MAKLVEDTSGSLQSEMRQDIESLRSELGLLQVEVKSGFDRVEASTGRNSRMLAAGTASVLALNRWAAQRDKLDRKRDREISDLRARLAKLERGYKRRAS
ncbi:MAG: hypothetical protein ABSC23_20810 [Bryobacteraceae bacterium]